MLTTLLSSSSDIEVVGAASDVFDVKDMIIEKRPDVVTLDVKIPIMDKITFLKLLMSFSAVPSNNDQIVYRENSMLTLEAPDIWVNDVVSAHM
ncbi:MAG: hypothetical protein JRJ43_01970 [Deltaproteobacteria bacterium]|nr:hypothetical protein [Deltaproteobacteria bacterium]MBW1932505.1 hypothetical protein [Deltaproteobacteria bacterium]MBW1937485.1 hypothetical protein [Deltaproteobacteria bacterium]MBW1964324.1 hypothetical protein [Deltaproteobacteria bacterium]MBW2079865.1 hypothetical protein [Deltaproteobacteria bacterium]